MRIPLDYYRILGIPFQVTGEQIEQAHDDRGRQLPRQEYSETAIEARKHLLDTAYTLLSDPDRRQDYDAQFLARVDRGRDPTGEELPLSDRTDTVGGSSPPPLVPTIEIAPEHFVGALLILQELGEYELVKRLGEEYLEDRGLAPLQDDIRLTLALAELELSRECWQEKAYEKAAETAEKALGWLENSQKFPGVVREIRHDFYRLRPYRILELLSRDLRQATARYRGLALLAEMLDDRGGIDGSGDDRSGLGIDDFLRFIQQLRVYLTLEEQQQIFEKEERRPSVVGKYLRVYALIAKGFARKQPESIVKASEGLIQLQTQQNVALEQAICALLLGQVERASTILENSQEKEILTEIRGQAPDSGDLLLGLCRYGEHWLVTEVFSHFRDLIDRSVSLKDYFADENVQNDLEELSSFPHEKTDADRIELSSDALESEVTLIATLPAPVPSLPARGVPSMSESAYSYSQPQKAVRERVPSARSASPRSRTRRNTPPRGGNTAPRSNGLMVTAAYRQPAVDAPRRPKIERATPQRGHGIEPTMVVAPPRNAKKRGKLRLDRVAILAAALVGTVAALGFGIKAIVDSQSPLAALTGEQLSIELNTPLLEIPAATAREIVPTALTPETAKTVIQSWLSAKSAAFSPNHQQEKLAEILLDPALSTWQTRASALKGGNYWQYEHQIGVRSVMTNPKNPNIATVEATVREKARYFYNGKENRQRSYDESIEVRYDLVRQGDKWLIQNTSVMK